MNPDVEVLLREGLDRLTAKARVPAGLAGRVLARRRRRRMAGYAAPLAAAVAVTAIVVVAAGPGANRTPGGPGPAATGPALATGYVVNRVENALTNDNRVMREAMSVAPNSASAGFFDGQLTYESVTWAYQGRNSTDFFGAHGELQAAMGTGIVKGKLQGVQVDYIRHGWALIPGMLSTPPVNACTTAGFLEATSDPGTNWPSLIGRTLACGGYKFAGYADIDGVLTVTITGSSVIHLDPPPGRITVTVTLFVSPATYLPVRITQSAAAPGEHVSPPTSADFQWLPPTARNRARASVMVPCGYQQIASPSGDLVRGRPSSACG